MRNYVANGCTGCTACVEVCPKNAITMQMNKEGFLYPVISEKNCVQCKLCEKVCPINKENNCENLNEVFAVKHKKLDVRKQSTSGGAFSVLADYVFDKKGWVFGAVYDEEMRVIHAGTNVSDDIFRFRGSKYTQSELANTFKVIEDYLKKEEHVLFTGTPCQCSGLKLYLDEKKINQSKLIICDIICHGVPSPLLWKDHMKSLENKHGKIKAYYCRSKIKGWHNHIEYCEWEDGHIEYGTRFLQKQKYIFYTNLCLRDSCGKCRFTTTNRWSDFTIADFWGIEKSHPEFDDNDGVSFFMINSKKGEKIFAELKEQLIYINASLEECMERQPNLHHPTPVNELRRNEFWRDYHKYGYMYVCRKYTEFGVFNTLKKQFARINRKVNSLIKKVSS